MCLPHPTLDNNQPNKQLYTLCQSGWKGGKLVVTTDVEDKPEQMPVTSQGSHEGVGNGFEGSEDLHVISVEVNGDKRNGQDDGVPALPVVPRAAADVRDKCDVDDDCEHALEALG